LKPFPWKCGNCRERAINPAVLQEYSADLEHDGRRYRVTVSDLRVARCDNCGTIMLDDSANVRLSDALRHEAGLLQPSEIRQQRDALGLTQKALASYLSIADATLSRWENGAQIQQRVMDKFLRVFFSCPQARAKLGAPANRNGQAATIVMIPGNWDEAGAIHARTEVVGTLPAWSTADVEVAMEHETNYTELVSKRTGKKVDAPAQKSDPLRLVG
jgi:putative zinc finger/helix-turn-helix YgiT family protein